MIPQRYKYGIPVQLGEDVAPSGNSWLANTAWTAGVILIAFYTGILLADAGVFKTIEKFASGIGKFKA